MREPREGDVVTESSLVAALRATRLVPAASVEGEAAISIVVGEAVVRELVSLQGNEELFEVFAASFAAPYA